MTSSEIMGHSMPYLEAICGQVNRIRMIEAGFNPDADKNQSSEGNESSPAPSHNYAEEESHLSDAEFYGRLNELLG